MKKFLPKHFVSEDGIVFRESKNGLLEKLKGFPNFKGYLRVRLPGGKQVSIHRIVATTFIPNPNNKPQVNHKNGNKLDNRVKNLEWVTCSENHQHAYDIGLMLRRFGADNHRSKAVLMLDHKNNVLKRFSSAREAERETGISNGNISGVCCGKKKSAGGFVWRFKSKKEETK